jgi:tape measure domain-containing protein
MSENSIGLMIRMTLENKQAIAGLGEMRSKVQSETREMGRAFQSLGSTLQSFGKTMTLAITAPLVGLGVASIKAAADMDSLKRGLTAVSGSSEETEKQLVRLREVAKLPGLGFKEAIQGSIQLQAVKLSANLAERSLMAFGNALATVGKGKAELDGVTLALTQIVSKGKVSAEEINQIAERVPQIREAMKAAFGTGDTEKIQKMAITSEQFIERIVVELEKLPRVSGGIQNTFENLSDTINTALVSIGDALLPIVSQIINSFVPVIEQLTNIFQALPNSAQLGVVAFAALAAALPPLIIGIGLVVSAIGTIITAVAAVGAPVAAGVAALVAVVAGAAALVVAAYETNFGGLRDFTVGLFETLKQGVAEGLQFVNDLWAKHGSEVVSLATTEYEGVKSVVLPALQAVVSFVKENTQIIVDFVRQNWPLIKQTIETVLNAVLASVRGVLEQVRAFWQAHGEQITTVARAAWDIIKTVIQTGLRTVLDVVKATMQIINGDWSGAWETFKGIVARAIGALETILSSIGRILIVALKAAIASALQLQAEINARFADIGKAIVDGVVNGIRNGISRVKDAVRDMALSAVGATKSELKSQSPSLVFFAIGQDVVKGFVNGIERGKAQVAGVLRDLINAPSLQGVSVARLKPAQRTKAAGVVESEAERNFNTQTADANRAFAERAASDEQFVNSQITAAEKLLNARLNVIAAERAEARATIKDRNELALKLAELNQQELNLTAQHAEQVNQIKAAARGRERDAVRAHQAALDEMADFAARREIESIQKSAESGFTARSDAERRIQEITDTALARQIAALEKDAEAARNNLAEHQRITDEIAKLNQQRAASAEDATLRIINAQARELTDSLPKGVNGGAPGLPATSQTRGGGDAIDFQKIDEMIGPPPDISGHIKVFDVLKETGMAAFGSLAQGAQGMIQSFLMAGNVGPTSMAKLAKGVASSLAAQALVESLMEVARGIAALAKAASNPLTAAMYTAEATLHFAAAKAFGLVGGIAAGVALALPSGSSSKSEAADTIKGNASANNSSSSANSNGPRIVEEDRNRNQQPLIVRTEHREVIEHVHEIRPPDGWVANEFVQAYRGQHQYLTESLEDAARRFG